MDTVKLNIRRAPAFVAAAMPYRVTLDGMEIARLSVGGTASVRIPVRQGILKVAMVGNSMTFHAIEKSVVLTPQKCKVGEIQCTINTKLNVGGFFSMGLGSRMGDLSIDVRYF